MLTIQVEKHIQELNIMMSKHNIFLFDLVDEKKRLIFYKLMRKSIINEIATTG